MQGDSADALMRILIIDDSRIFQSGLRRALAKAGHELTVASDGDEGLNAARQTLPDLILLDMMLPGGVGHRSPVGTKERTSHKGHSRVRPHRAFAKKRRQAPQSRCYQVL
jgi:CheY-like chemotaxis protein